MLDTLTQRLDLAALLAAPIRFTHIRAIAYARHADVRTHIETWSQIAERPLTGAA